MKLAMKILGTIKRYFVDTSKETILALQKSLVSYSISVCNSYLGHDPFVETETGFRSVSVDLRDPFVKLKPVLRNW